MRERWLNNRHYNHPKRCGGWRLLQDRGSQQIARWPIVRLLLAVGVLLSATWDESPVVAQMVQADGSTSGTSSCATSCTITGGLQQGPNLFHSFTFFSVNEGQTVLFSNPLGVDRIFSRVTGTQSSSILGTLGVDNPAQPTQVFLINPNGILFGPNARLNMTASFVATTAQAVLFADGTEFSASQTTPPLLTVAVPIGLQFNGSNPGNIINQARGAAPAALNLPAATATTSGHTLAMVGGNVQFEGGIIRAVGGRVELGAVQGVGSVQLTPIAQGWQLGYGEVSQFGDITMTAVGTTAMGLTVGLANPNVTSPIAGGGIQIVGRQVVLSGDVRLSSFSGGSQPGGDLVIQADRFIAENGPLLQLGTTATSTGNSGNIVINARESVDLSGSRITGTSRFSTLISSRTAGTGAAGSLTVNTGQLTLRSGAQLSTSTFGAGPGGVLTVNARDRVSVLGTSDFNSALDPTSQVQVSGIFSQSTETATGNAGTLTINTPVLLVQDGSQVSARTLNPAGQGEGGNLAINASQLVEVAGVSTQSGSNSFMSAASQGGGAAGSLTISTPRLVVRDGGSISVSGTGTGAAGDLKINAPTLFLENQGQLTAETTAGRGNIDIIAQDLRLRQSSTISTNATGPATGGNITIATNTLVLLENSKITANAQESFGGRVVITTQGLFLSPGSAVTATSALGSQFNGTVVVQTPEASPGSGLIELPTQVVDLSGLVAQGCSAIRQTNSSFTITGRGGLPPSPNETLTEEITLVDLGRPVVQAQAVKPAITLPSQSAVATAPPHLVWATGWRRNPTGQVELVAIADVPAPALPATAPSSCGLPVRTRL